MCFILLIWKTAVNHYLEKIKSIFNLFILLIKTYVIRLAATSVVFCYLIVRFQIFK